MRVIVAGVLALALGACTDEAKTAVTEASPAASQVEDGADLPAPPVEAALTPEDSGGFTEDGFTFETRVGAKHVVRLPSPGSDTWRAASPGEPAVRQTGSRKETAANGKPALVFEYEMLEAGRAAIEFERLEDGEVEGRRTITFVVH